MDSPYQPRRPARSVTVTVRGLRLHLLRWGDPAHASAERPPLVLLHGWMDVADSFQFMVDALDDARAVFALDWRGFGGSDPAPGHAYWFPDYLADLDAVLDAVAPGAAVDLLGHSMGGNVAMLYAGVRPARVRRLVSLEGFGLPDTRAAQAPGRYAQWLDELREAPALRPYASLDEVAARLRRTNARLAPGRAAWLAARWAARGDDGLWHLRADPAHKRVNPVLYRAAEVVECWRRIAAPVLWVEGAQTDLTSWWGARYPREEFEARLAAVPDLRREVLSPAGHMLHHDQPEALARQVEAFL